MRNISEIISDDGEVISISASESQAEFNYKILNNLDFETIKSFFIKKCVLEAVKEKHNLSNGSNGITKNELLINVFKWSEIENFVTELEQKIVDAIEDTEYKEGDRVWLFFKEDGTLELCENFTGEYDKMALVKKLYNTAKLFWPVLGKEVFINYSLKKNKELLNAIQN